MIVRVPDWWQTKRPPRPEVQITVGKKDPAGLGLDALIDFDVALSLEGETLTEAEWREIQKSAAGLVSIKGRWVEIDKDKLQQVLDHWRRVQEAVADDGISFVEAMRLMAGAAGLAGKAGDRPELTPNESDWSKVVAGDWLARTLAELRNPDTRADYDLGDELKASLRPYQKAGVQWLWLLHRLKLGACLADDMGLSVGSRISNGTWRCLMKRRRSKIRVLSKLPPSNP